jgi:hypothetical protein
MMGSEKSATLLLLATLAAGTFAACSDPMTAEAMAGQSAGPQASAGLESFLESYFASWSSGDMGAYKAHFDQHAVIMFMENGQIRSVLPSDSFVALQSKAIADAKTPMVERMTSYAADADGMAATVAAKWLLERSDETETGTDRFTLIRDGRGNWKIVFLLFYLDR